MKRALGVSALCLAACAAPTRTSPRPTPELGADEAHDDAALPPAASSYATTATAPAARGRETTELTAAVADALAARGAGRAEADGALAATARWFLAAQAARRDPRHADAEAVARRLGFAGVVPLVLSFPLDGPDAVAWREELTKAPANLVINRYGVHTSPSARAGAVVFGAVEIALDPFPTRVAVGQAVRLRGEAHGRYEVTRLYITGVDGKVEERRFPRRTIDTSVKLPRAGTYKVEIIGDGPTGPVVLVNVPITVGAPQQARESVRLGTVAPAAAESRLFALLNEARARAGVPPVAPDPELRDVALAHTEDMLRARFFGHVSPTTGTVEDRLKRAGVDVTVGGENLAQARTAEEAHEGLMESPGHRANLLAPRFTHVGIAVVSGDADVLTVTQVFGRRPPQMAARRTRAEVVEAVAAARRAANVAPLILDPGLQSAADAGAAVVAAGDPSGDAAVRAAATTLQRQHRRGGGCARLYELRELDELTEVKDFVDPKLGRVGLAVATREDRGVERLVILLLADGAGCR